MIAVPMLLVFVDGLGIGPADPLVNPVHSGACPCLERLLDACAAALDARLGVPGLPQSATGQATLLTGINAAQIEGRHVEGFPGNRLRTLIREHNIFRQLAARRLSATFANAYFLTDIEDIRKSHLQSATTVATLSAFGGVRDRQAMETNRAVYHDLTRECLRPRGYTGPRVAPAEAARHLVDLAREHAFTLFEFFKTDHAGHTADRTVAMGVLRVLDEFLAVLAAEAEAGRLLLALTSDHGNIEDLRTHAHTLNPVPFAAVGPGAEALRKGMASLTDVTPALLKALAGGAAGSEFV